MEALLAGGMEASRESSAVLVAFAPDGGLLPSGDPAESNSEVQSNSIDWYIGHS